MFITIPNYTTNGASKRKYIGKNTIIQYSKSLTRVYHSLRANASKLANAGCNMLYVTRNLELSDYIELSTTFYQSFRSEAVHK